jgi:hypothetical protein
MNIIEIFIITVLVTAMIYILPLEKEGFTPKEYTIAHNTRLLDDKQYSQKTLNEDSYTDLYMLKPHTKLSSYKQITNNNEEYMKPCIGNSINICQRVNMLCGSI